MSAKRNWILLVLAVLIALPAMASAQTKIGIANTARIFNEMQETRDLRDRVNQERQALVETERQKQQQIRALQEGRDALRPDAPEYQKRNEELMRQTIEYRIWGETVQQNLQRTQKQQVARLFEKIEAASSEIAQQQGFDLILAQQHNEVPTDQEKISPEQFTAMMAQRNVLYNSEAIDLTDEILALLDQKYKSGQ